MKIKNRRGHFTITFVIISSFFMSCTNKEAVKQKLDMTAYLAETTEGIIYPSAMQIEMIKDLVPEEKFLPCPSSSDRKHWETVATKETGKKYLEEAIALIDKAPEVPISDEIYRRANREGNRGIYKPRYYRTMDRLEKFIIGECIENNGRFIPQIEVYCDSIMAMKSWLHPNHDDNKNTVLEGKRVSIDLGARKFAWVLSLADVLLEDKLPEQLRTKIRTQLKWRITDSYLSSCKLEDDKSNSWIRSTSNWNSVCTSGSLLTILTSSDSHSERVAAIGSALNSMVYYLSGFGQDGYCSEGTGYWNYGFGHYLYLAEIIDDYTNGAIDLFTFNNPEKLRNTANFPHNFQIHPKMYAPFSDGVTRIKEGSDNFAYIMASKHYGALKQKQFVPDESVQTLIAWKDGTDYTAPNDVKNLPSHTYFDDMGILISRGQQAKPMSIAIKAGHNAENHNHMDVGSYVLVLGEEYIAGDIGAPSYTAGAFSDKNPARSSWGHPVPRVNNKLQSKGIQYAGKILGTGLSPKTDGVLIDLKPAYEVEGLTTLQRNMMNDKDEKGAIAITDHFEAEQAINFGTAVSTFSEVEMIDSKSFMLTGVHFNEKVKVEVNCEGGDFDIIVEPVPVKHLRSGKNAKRIGIDFKEKLKTGTIMVRYTALN